ncbi:hypothetical protein StoSoilB3_03620 [Arthrobacter sp. StoSoilB3]|nr:hypothetical protein NtRootA2_03710 [Arthrobacter sp. NtRootA2]BCW13170.1 hypothetical protein NtRootA4_01490 [Arthrobacter sp. NtRootA4]BCW21506.1 hypothetical protein NtRootC7_03730 [Arthrobacter sp. NtRootC7]BCW25773.1 hypothetical protein NtRootC45_03730 [Arthrobacter sp. NtRootC45]BCW30042.1 hypothetical protein NtRootD5_03730 [Arthrobacter sp. NtRootD5]BCW38827.1 hypothetical protein StoSoilB3_03620 [Arthrobacter sp. StoSoilB3]
MSKSVVYMPSAFLGSAGMTTSLTSLWTVRVSDDALALASVVAQPLRSKAADASAATAADMVLGREITAVLLILRGGGELPVAALLCHPAAEVRYTYPNNALLEETAGFYSEPAKG